MQRVAVGKAPDRIAGMFDAIAGRYDFLNHFLSAGLDRRWRARAIRALDLTGREVVLDLCTGTADLAIAAIEAGDRGAARVVGVDFAAEMLRVGREKLRTGSLDKRVTLVRGDATQVPLAADAVDAVTIAFGIRNVQDPERACAEMLRVLEPGGRIAILEFGLPRAPILRRAYLWYFNTVLPRIGRLVSKHPDAYTYLPASVGAFYTADNFTARLRRCGFTSVAANSLTGGIVYLYTGKKTGDRRQEVGGRR
jgi:demethylmenaquinone methyltransferase/2-methoxy-6-polyprenyl-1,4-benzoquinol methylase